MPYDIALDLILLKLNTEHASHFSRSGNIKSIIKNLHNLTLPQPAAVAGPVLSHVTDYLH